MVLLHIILAMSRPDGGPEEGDPEEDSQTNSNNFSVILLSSVEDGSPAEVGMTAIIPTKLQIS